ncbi:MAG: hypothetical protein LBK13_02430 [Spirochaetales bacterium]|jgi:hypothetical protein|nr:hypothetical protein [Spirochaetales bacterium]
MEAIPLFETQHFVFKPFTRSLTPVPAITREWKPDFAMDDDSYRAVEFADGPIPAGKVRFTELLLLLHSIIAAGSISKDEYERTLAYLDSACVGNESGGALRVAVLLKDGDAGDTLAALVHLVNPSAPELELNTSGRIPGFREKGYEREIIAAFLPWARSRYGFNTFRLYDPRRGKESAPPDTVSVYNPKEPEKKYYGHINFAPGDVSIDVYEKPVRPLPEIRELRIDCGGGVTMLLDITLERDIQYYDYEDYNWKISSAFDEDVGDTAEELIAGQRGFYETLFGVWKGDV